MNQHCVYVVLLVSAFTGVQGHCQTTIAGRTVDDYATRLDDANRVVRLAAIHSLGAFGTSAAEPLTKSLDHDDPAVRYVGARHLGLKRPRNNRI